MNDFSVSGNSDGKGSIAPDPACGAPCERQTYAITYPYLYPNTKENPQKLPNIAITGLTTQDNGPYPGAWSGFVEDITDSVTKVIRNHTFVFGGIFEHAGENDSIQLTTASPPQTENQNGAFQFLDSGLPNTTGVGMANALIGNFNSYAEFGAKPETPWIVSSVEFYGQDTWQVTHSLSLHYGIRYSLWPGWGTTNGTIAQFEPQYYNSSQAATVNPSTGYITSGSPYNGVVLPGSGPSASALKLFPILSTFASNYHNLPASFITTQKNLVQPRLGIAYQIMNNTVVRAGIGFFADHTAVNRDTALGGNPPFMPQTSLLYGNMASLASASSVTVPLTMTITAGNVWPDAWDYNTTVQHQFRGGLNLSAGFVGNRGLHLQRKRNINQITTLDAVYANPTVNPNALRPYLGAGIIDESENTGLSWYKALQVQFTKNSGPLTLSSSYTLSKSTDNTSILTDVLPDSYDDHDYWGRSDFNVPQALTLSYVYNTHFRRGSALVKAAINDWALSGINQFEAGEPFSVRENIDYAGIGPGSGNQFWNITGNPNGCSTGFLQGVGATKYCKSAFAAPANGTFANGQNRNVFSNPGFWEWNMAVHKQFPIGIHEGTTLEFRAESFDVLNHANWGSTDSTPLDSSFMQVKSKTDNRNLQFQLKLAF